ncbi:MAG: acyl-ACP--UDP-N-acetylglucosamine O-acyltransferase [Bacteroidetes bacterium]|nr:acyl-ACP--UDP-N-acetylglucosamine O-acyltransferase [Bacteroidota bacterium]
MNYPFVSIHPDARIGKNVKIDPFVTIHGDVEIGDETWIGSNVTIMDGARIGSHCRVFPGAVISAIPQDLKFSGEKTTVEIGDHVTIRECVTLNRGTVDRMTTKIGSHSLIMAYSHVAHDCLVGEHCILANAVNMAGHVVVDDYAIIGGMTAVHQFTHIGSHVMISGGSLVRKDIPPFVKAGREPLAYVGVNSIGLRRRGFSNERINQIQEVYRVLYLSGLNTTKALQKIEAELPATPERDEIMMFVQNARRGIMRGYGSEE